MTYSYQSHCRAFASMATVLVCILNTSGVTAVAAEVGVLRSGGWFAPCAEGRALHFTTGFEGGEHVLSDKDGRRGSIVGSAERYPCRVLSVGPAPEMRFGGADIQFEGGSDTERGAEVVAAPNDKVNHALRFWIAQPNVIGEHSPRPVKGRVQMNVSGNKGIRKLALSVRMLLTEDFNIVRSFPGMIDWLTISEWWNNASWRSESYPFRITVNLVKETPGPNAPLFFQVHAQTLDMVKNRWGQDVWSAVNREFVVPVGKWMTLDYKFLEGDRDQGRFMLAATIQGNKKNVIFDITNYTHHPDDPSPDGLSDFNPMKLYTSSRLINFVHEQRGTLEIFWDDFQLVACQPNDGRPDESKCGF